MRIKYFSQLVNEHLQPYNINGKEVVIDGENLFHSTYKESGVQFVLGSESDRYADYLRDYLQMFKKADVECHIIIKGGHETVQTLKSNPNRRNAQLDGKSYILENDYEGQIIQPCLAKDIFMEILNEMGFDFTVCYTNDVVGECIALARRMSCPVISFNIQYCFFSVQYLPLRPGEKFKFAKNNKVTCGVFTRDNFIEAYGISTEKIIIFILLTDTDIFRENFFNTFLKNIRNGLSLSYIKRYKNILYWLKNKSRDETLDLIIKHIPILYRNKICPELGRNKIFPELGRNKIFETERVLTEKFLNFEYKESLSNLYYTNRDKVEIKDYDPLWFEKGVALKHVAVSYINLYMWSIVNASHLIEDYEQPNSIMLSIDVIKYAHDLLKNFIGKEITIRESLNNEGTVIKYTQSVRKPEYSCNVCVFGSGWHNIDSRNLFEHFFLETFLSFNFEPLKGAPEDSRLLLIAMVYFARKKSIDVSSEIYSIMLSYVMLGVVADKADRKLKTNDVEKSSQPILDPVTDKALVEVRDCEITYTILAEYFTINKSELHNIFDRKKLHPLIEFERCLQEINYLNTLCGSPFTSTVYSKTYNGTFVYKFLCSTQDDDALEFIKTTLNPAATVLAFTLGMIELYEGIMYDYY